MGKNKSRSVMGDYSGTVGTVVLAIYRGIPTMRSKPKPSSKPASRKQLDQREIFKIVTKLLWPLKEDFIIGYQLPKKSGWSPKNAAISYHILHAMGGAAENRYFDLAKLRLTKPMRKTQSVWNPEVYIESGNLIIISWELNPFPQKCTQPDDKICIVMYNKTNDRFVSCRKACNRADLSFSYTFAPKFRDHEIYFYMYLVSADGKLVSETEYLGMAYLPG